MTASNYPNLKTRIQKQQKKKIRKVKFYHSFLTIILILCVLQISYSAFLNFTKIVLYQSKIYKAQHLKAQAESRNKHLKNEIKNFSSMYKVESIARNNLKMAAKDEVLIIINQPNEESKEENNYANSPLMKFFEQFASKFNKDILTDKFIE